MTTRNEHAVFLCLSFAAALCAGCAGEGNPSSRGGSGSGGDSNIGPAAGGTVDFKSQVQPIFDGHCSCHLSLNAPQGLVLLSGVSYGSLVNVPSTQIPSIPRVVPGDPDNSYLVIKIDNGVPEATSPLVGEIMPRGLPPLADADIETIRRWIEEGALRVPEQEDEEDTAPPMFNGAKVAVTVSQTEIDVFWDPAIDDETAQQDILYKVFTSTKPGAQNLSQPSVLAPRGSSGVRVAALDAGTRYYFVVRAEDESGNQDDNLVEVSARTLEESGGPGTEIPPRGDVDDDGELTITDAITILNHLFLGGTPPGCAPVADANADGTLNITDAIYILRHLFLGGDPPPELSEQDLEGCDPDSQAIERGRDVYSRPDGPNLYSCAHCHASVPDEESELLHPGHSLHDALRRPSFKLGEIDSFLEAANFCRLQWMHAIPWEEEDLAFQDFVAFLESVSPEEPAPALVYDIVSPKEKGPATGDPQAGCELYHRSCVICHGPNAAGTDIGRSLVAIRQSAYFVRLKVRLSGPQAFSDVGLIGGVMSFWAKDKLSDDQIEDIAAYLWQRPLPECGGGGAER